MSEISSSWFWSDAAIDRLAEVCVRNRFRNDWHYDVVALHRDSPVQSVEVAETAFARAKPSCY